MEDKEVILNVEGLRKTFTLSRKQQRIEQTQSKLKVAVDDVSFHTYRGEIFGLLGSNGAGKTTTLRMLSTLIKPDSGDAILDGCSVVREPERVREKIGFLTSELKLEDFFTPNYLFDFFSRLHQVPEEVSRKHKEQLFERFGIGAFAEVKVANLSTGMKQKLSIAVSLVHDPEVIIFDEPTNGLDVLTARVVTDYLQEQRSEGKSIILSTHIFSLVERLCDRVGVLIDGQMAAYGTLAEVSGGMSLEERFFEIYKQQKGGEE